jgi:glycoside/pentoside/hexuronide:cation symporter, GPH family
MEQQMADIGEDMVATVEPQIAGGAPRIPLSISLGFGVGTVGVSILLNTVAVYFPAMMVTVLGFSPAVAGYLLTGSKIYDVGADLAIGVVSDRTRSRWGRRRPFLFLGSLIGALAFVALFNPPPALSGTALIAVIALVLVVYSTGYSLFNVPYLAMPSEMTSDYHQRTNLLSYRTFFISIGQLIALSGAAALIALFGGDRAGYSRMGLVLGGIVLLATMASFFGTANADKGAPVEHAPRLGFLKNAKLALQNRPFVMLIACKFCNLLALSATTSTQLLFLLNVAKVGYQGQLALSLGLNIAMGLSMPIWVLLGKLMGKRNGYIAATVVYALATLSWLLAGPGEPTTALVVRGAFTGISSGGMLLLGISMLPDTMEYDLRRTGLQRAGVFSSVYAIIEKLAFAVGPGLIGVYLAAMHYVPTMHGHLVAQPPSAVHALYVGMALIPVALSAIGILLLLFYKLDEKTLKAA